ncbi:MAG: tail fiber domain-containing protein [Candidatus Eremiobacteraeota bacterium]|nr:tail fiber domain-containing protein [Candidatus Eremiobacteraeota bacterium]
MTHGTSAKGVAGRAITPPHCTRSGGGSFVGGGSGNIAGGGDSGILSGAYNNICDYGSTIGGGEDNSVSSSGGGELASDSVIGGGDTNIIDCTSSCIGNNGVVAGFANLIYGNAGNAFIGSGSHNTISIPDAAIAGGNGNNVSGEYGSIGGGYANTVSGEYGAVAGGYGDTASGEYASVAGGAYNVASGSASFAGGDHADADYNGSFVWSDESSGSSTKATAANQFMARAAGGVTFFTNAAMTTGVKVAAGSGTWSSVSDRNLKNAVTVLDDQSILNRVAAMPVTEWSYISEPGVRHVGPMAQDFYAAFGVGEDDKHITSIDEDGIAFAAIKALRSENVWLRAELAAQRTTQANEKAQLRQLAAEVAALQRR